MTGLPITGRQLLVGGTAVLVATLVSCLPKSSEWLGSWGETGAALENATVLTYPLMTGMTAWFASAPQRQGFSPLLHTSTRHPLTVAALPVAAAAGSCALAALVAAAPALVATSRSADFGSPPLLTLACITCGFFAAAAFGGFLASILPGFVAAPVAIAIVYGAQMVAALSAPAFRGPLAGLTVADGRERTYRATAEWMLALRGGWLVAMAALLLALTARCSTAFLASLAVVSATATPLLFVGSAGMTLVPAATRPVCHRAQGLSVCLTAARDHLATDVETATRPLASFLEALSPHGEVRLSEFDLQRSSSPRPGPLGLVIPFGVPYDTDGDAHRVQPDQLNASIATTVLQSRCGPKPPAPIGTRPKATANDVLELWLLDQAGVDLAAPFVSLDVPPLDPRYLDYSPLSRFRSSWGRASWVVRARWLRAHSHDVLRCALTRHDLSQLP